MAKKVISCVRVGMCCDCRNLGSQTVKDAFPLHRVNECFARLGNARFSTALYMASAFWHIPLRPSDEYKTAFACELGLFQWKVIGYGLCDAPPTFQRMMTITLKDIQPRYGSLEMLYRRRGDSNFFVGRSHV